MCAQGFVRPDKLIKAIDSADRILVKEGPFEEATILYTSTKPQDLEELKASVRVVVPGESFHCMCAGEPAIELYDGATLLVKITNHHGISLRCSLWYSDAELEEPERWLSWFDARGIDGPRREVEESEAYHRKRDADYERWLDAMPVGLQETWDEVIEDGFVTDLALLQQAFAAVVEDEKQRILLLFHWYGSGAGPWSGYPSYEDVAEAMLLDVRVESLVEALRPFTSHPRSILEGAARFFAGWGFSRKKARQRRKVPPALKDILWEHAKTTENRRIAHNAFVRKR